MARIRVHSSAGDLDLSQLERRPSQPNERQPAIDRLGLASEGAKVVTPPGRLPSGFDPLVAFVG